MLASHSPNSDRSIYFDAPTTISDNIMSSSPEILPSAQALGPWYDLNAPASVQNRAPFTPEEQSKSIVEHPNGSEGWLPAESTAPVSVLQPSLDDQNRQLSSFQSHPEDLPVQTEGEFATGGAVVQRAHTTANATPSNKDQALGRSSSTRRSEHTTVDGRPLAGSAFDNGAGATGPMATVEEDEALRARAVEAHEHLSPKQKAKVAKEECEIVLFSP
jgi:hypothetical protein